MTKALLISCIFVLGCSSLKPLTQQERNPAMATSGTSEEACQKFINSLPPSIVRGYLEVPKDWFKNSRRSENIRIFYYAKLVDVDSKSAKDPILALDGGPTYPSWYLYQSMSSRLQSSKVSVVFMDPRGTGCSTNYPKAIPPDPEVSLNHYDSRHIVMDAEVVRKHLFGEQSRWRVYGVSNGGLISLRYLTMKPESLKAVYTNSFGLLWNKFEYPHYERLYTLEKTKGFFQKHPGVEDILKGWLQTHILGKCTANGKLGKCALGALPDKWRKMIFDDSKWSELYKGIVDLANTSVQDGETEKAVKPIHFTTGAEAAVYAITRTEYIDYKYSEQDPFYCKPAEKKLLESIPLQYLPFVRPCEEYSPSAVSFLAKLKSLPAADLKLSDVKKSLDKFKDIEFLSFGGGRDFVVPPTFFYDQQKVLGARFKHFIDPTRQHGEPTPEIYKAIFGEDGE